MANDDTEELRLALVMNGGVSLAVWMGGVTNEVARLVCAHQQDEVYASLLLMTNSTARVDVISGTSAGGVNGAALSVAMLYKGQFSWLKDIWLKVGSFSALLRQPVGQNPGSLLDGDGYFLPEIEKGLASLAGPLGTPRPAGECPLDLRLTTTLLQGEPGRYVDDLGTPINDVNHRAYFHFQHRVERSDFDTRDAVIPLLAKAARSTASFPFAFEPSLVDKPWQRLMGEDGQPLTGERFVVDGGVLDNKPFRGALQAMFSMPRQRGVRRVLAYVNPDPGSDAQNTQARPDDDDGACPHGKPKTPALSRVMAASVLGIPQAQSIADQLRGIEQHNDKVRARRDAILTLVSAFEGAPGRVDANKILDLTRHLYSVYRTRRLVNTYELFVWPEALKADARLRAQASGDPQLTDDRPPTSQRQLLGKRQRAWLLQAFMAQSWVKWLPQDWPLSAAASANQANSWQWGMFPIEFSARLMLDLLRRTQALVWYDDATPRLGDTLAVLWTQANLLTTRLVKRREDEKTSWASGSDAFMACMQDWQSDLSQAADHLKDQMMDFLSAAERQAFCGKLANDIALTIWQSAAQARTVVHQALLSPRLRQQDRTRATELALLAQFLAPEAQDESRLPTEAEVQATVYRLLQLEVIEYAFTNHEELNSDTLIEMVQISGDAQSPLGGPGRAADKLLGLQLAHFAAFYKQSWRANDWIYGRLDGSERLVRVLLNPERLYRRYTGTGVDTLIADLKVLVLNGRLPDLPSAGDTPDPQPHARDALKDIMAMEWHDVDQDELRRELAFITEAGLALPDHLPLCTRLITTRMHYDILLNELPVLRQSITNDRVEGADLSTASNAVMQGVPEHGAVLPETAVQLLRNGLIAHERLLSEAGSDLFTRTVGHTLATLQSTMAAKAAKLGPVGTFFATLRLPFFIFYLASQVLTRQTRTQAALHGGLLLAGLAMVLAPFALSAPTVPSWWQGLSWGLFTTGMILSLMRTPRTVLLALAVWIVAVLAFQPRQWLYVLLAATLLAIPALLSRVLMSWLAAVGMLLLGAAWSAGYTTWDKLAGDLQGGHWPKLMATSPLAFAGLITLVMLLAVFESSVLGRRTEAAISRGFSQLQAWIKRWT
jgi:patatin-related protein